MLNETIKACLAETPASVGQDLRGFKLDLDYYLEQLGIFSAVRTSLTGDRRCQLSATCTIALPDAELAEAAKIAANQWKQHIAYPYFAACEVVERADGMDIDFVTSSGKGSGHRCVTGTIMIRLSKPRRPTRA